MPFSVFGGLFGINGRLITTSPVNNTVIQQPQSQNNSIQGIQSGLAISMQQQGMNHIQGAYQQAASYMTIQSMQAMQQQVQQMYDPWYMSRYTRDEVNMAVGHDYYTQYGYFGTIVKADAYVKLMDDGGNFHNVQPLSVDSIPFIDELRKTPMWKLTKS